MSSSFISACLRQNHQHTPIWLMRQAGRYMPVYRKLREKYSMLELIHNAELSAQVTLQPLERFNLDAGIIFADILTPLIGMGFDLDFVAGKGPVIANPITKSLDIDRLAVPPAQETLGSTLKAIEIVTDSRSDLPLIGFCGAPLTLASYAIEGSGTKQYIKTRRLMLSHRASWDRLMNKLVTVQADYLIEQAKHGAKALQIFDSWLGQALSFEHLDEYVWPYIKNLVQKVKAQTDVPLIYFSLAPLPYLMALKKLPIDVVGLSWQVDLQKGCEALQGNMAIQGNLDPALLASSWSVLKPAVDRILSLTQTSPGFIFNVGQGLSPLTKESLVEQLVDYVHEQSSDRSK